MKEKLSIFLCAFAVLFFASCIGTDLSVDEESAIKADLPSDFDWKIYAEINADIANSQIVFDVQEKNKAFSGADSAKKAISNCINFLKNEELAEKIYLDYAVCPRKGWNKNGKCPGIYVYNPNYNIPTVKDSDTTWQCIIGPNAYSESCWRGGWDMLADNEIDPNLKPLKDTLSRYLESVPTTINFGPVKTMCMFIPAEESDVLSYLSDFKLNKLNSALVIEHYNSMGFYDGRPYKYCEGNHGVEKTLALADKRGAFYDYSRYTFCLDKNDQKIYVAQ